MTVAIVADYAVGDARTSDRLHETLAALARQTYPGSIEFLLGDSVAASGDMRLARDAALPGLRECVVDVATSYELKNACVREARADRVAILDADCRPAPDWLARLMAAMDAHPRAAAISGRTLYAGRSLTERVLGALTRGYLDPGRAGVTRFVSNNSALWRRGVHLDHPLPVGLGAFSARIQSEAVLRAGHELRFEPDARVEHAFEGWRMERDIRRNIGHATIATRFHDASLPHARWVRLGVAALPLVVLGKTIQGWRDGLRCASAYGVRAWERPAVVAGSVVVHAMEIPGMWRAYRGAPLNDTAYR